MEQKHVLVVDDEKRIVELIRYQLEVEGFKVDEAYDGENALKKAKQIKPNIIILDLMLPKIDGLKVCEELKTEREYNSIPIIMLTARSKEDDEFRGYRVGADRYMTKPFDVDELMTAIREVLTEKEYEKKHRKVSEKVVLTLQSKIESIRQVNQLVSRLYSQTSLSNDDVMSIDFVLMELLQNAVEHGNRNDQNRLIKFAYTLYPDKLVFSIEDEGEGFSSGNVPQVGTIIDKLLKGESDIPQLKSQQGRPGGLGLYLAKLMVDDIEFNEKGNRVTITKYLPESNHS